MVSRAGVLIKASLTEIWRLHTDIDRWQSWIPEIVPAHKKMPGPLRPGSVFSWSPQNMHVESTIKTVEPLRCTAWGGGIHLSLNHTIG
ncbi:hypothetical protein [Amycolatopsis sp. NPDC051371]|uniref:hypothetical protein n=1 Tax=Amycolatopsis sp. NPDC051371 TaxID=3155800 RepID=UPI00343E4739